MSPPALPADALDRLHRKTDLPRLLAVLSELEPAELQRLIRTAGRKSSLPESPPINSDLYDIESELDEAERDILLRWRAFMCSEVAPIINEYWERGEFPMQLIPKIGALVMETIGKGQTHYPRMSPLLSGMLTAEVARVDPSLCSFLGVHRRLCMTSIWLFGSQEQKDRWLPPMLRFEKIGSWVLSEPLVGSGAARGLLTTARRVGDDWVLNGEKKWSGNATFADVNCIWARNAETGEVNGFLVERGMPGYHVEKIHDKISKRVVQNVLITLDGCRVPEANRLPGARSFDDVAGQLTNARADVAWEAVGIARGAYEQALAYALQREQFGRKIAAFQAQQLNLARMLGNVTAMQGMLVQLTRSVQRNGGRISPEQASLAKAWCTERMRETVAIARAVLGGNGILLEHNVARLFADAESVYSYEGSYEINSLIVGKAITGYSAFV
ncbi:MAG: acyl-CoA dehydrogenase family protein [Anaerolineae bacterium]|nr:acyl-CoA dehydrogenase family protein [Anaerolineae bacterium]